MGAGQWQQYLPARSNLSELVLPEGDAEDVDLTSPVEHEMAIIPPGKMQSMQSEVCMFYHWSMLELLEKWHQAHVNMHHKHLAG